MKRQETSNNFNLGKGGLTVFFNDLDIEIWVEVFKLDVTRTAEVLSEEIIDDLVRYCADW